MSAELKRDTNLFPFVKTMILSKYLVVASVTFFLVLQSLREETSCSVIIKTFRALKKQSERFKPFEERSPRVSGESELSDFEKRQLYWYYKAFVGRREANKIWKDQRAEGPGRGNITDEEIFAGKSFIPLLNGLSRLGRPVPSSTRSAAPTSFSSRQAEAGVLGSSNVVFHRGDNALRVDWLGRLRKEEQGPEKTDQNGSEGVVPPKGRAGQHGGDSFYGEDYVWASIVSPCNGEVQFNLELEAGPYFGGNNSLYIIYCENGDVRERYSSFKGKVVEFLNGRFDSPGPGPRLDLNQRFPVKKGELILRILENYCPPMFESNLIAIPIFMPCTGRTVWGKQHKRVFVKGEKIVEFICLERNEVTSKHLISPSRGYTESFQRDNSSEQAAGFLDQSFNSSVIQAGDPLGVMWLELNSAVLAKERSASSPFSKEQDRETLVRMPCSGRLEYPLSESSFALKNEVSPIYCTHRQCGEVKRRENIDFFFSLLSRCSTL